MESVNNRKTITVIQQQIRERGAYKEERQHAAVIHDHAVVESGQRGYLFELVELLQLLHGLEPFVADLPREPGDRRLVLAQDVEKLVREACRCIPDVVVHGVFFEAEREVVVVGCGLRRVLATASARPEEGATH